MARTKSTELCMLCGECPCECNKKVSKPTKKPRKLTIETVAAPVLTQQPSILDAMRKAAADAPKIDLSHLKDPPKRTGYKPLVAAAPVIETDVKDLLFADAVRNLAPILHETEIEKYKILITSQPSASDRARVWRARRYG